MKWNYFISRNFLMKSKPWLSLFEKGFFFFFRPSLRSRLKLAVTLIFRRRMGPQENLLQSVLGKKRSGWTLNAQSSWESSCRLLKSSGADHGCCGACWYEHVICAPLTVMAIAYSPAIQKNWKKYWGMIGMRQRSTRQEIPPSCCGHVIVIDLRKRHGNSPPNSCPILFLYNKSFG
jgi:hypothetical protein